MAQNVYISFIFILIFLNHLRIIKISDCLHSVQIIISHLQLTFLFNLTLIYVMINIHLINAVSVIINCIPNLNLNSI